MFTGIIETTGEVLTFQPRGEGGRLAVRAETLVRELRLGESVAVNGCCLTAAELETERGSLVFDLLLETLRATTLGDLKPGDRVNLERALPADGRFGGHFVQGHVDAASSIAGLEAVGDDYKLTVNLPREAAGLVIPRGSIAVDGISLTAAELGSDQFSVWIIPHTWKRTNLSQRRVGDRVNLEFDLLGKYVLQALQLRETDRL
ncbi:MAG TPA: riboflavin synthase [Verrucomicrobiales bacterium]|nr:riboflavin synthase [Verrucomicrobiales bacterium]